METECARFDKGGILTYEEMDTVAEAFLQHASCEGIVMSKQLLGLKREL